MIYKRNLEDTKLCGVYLKADDIYRGIDLAAHEDSGRIQQSNAPYHNPFGPPKRYEYGINSCRPIGSYITLSWLFWFSTLANGQIWQKGAIPIFLQR